MSNISFIKKLPVPENIPDDYLLEGDMVEMVVEVELRNGGFGISQAVFNGPKSGEFYHFASGKGHSWEKIAEDYLINQFLG